MGGAFFRKLLMNMSLRISKQVVGPWLVWGDFNAIYSESQSFNGSKVTRNEVIDCMMWKDQLDMFDHKSGGQFLLFY